MHIYQFNKKHYCESIHNNVALHNCDTPRSHILGRHLHVAASRTHLSVLGRREKSISRKVNIIYIILTIFPDFTAAIYM